MEGDLWSRFRDVSKTILPAPSYLLRQACLQGCPSVSAGWEVRNPTLTSSLSHFLQLSFTSKPLLWGLEDATEICEISIYFPLYMLHKLKPLVEMLELLQIPPDTSATGCRFHFSSASSFLPELFLCSSPVSYWTSTVLGGFLCQCCIALPFHTVHGVLKARMLKYQSTTCEMLGWVKLRLESRLPGEILVTSDMQMTPS